MAKETGLGWTTLTIDDSAGSPQDIRNDIFSLSWTTPRAVIEDTGIDKSAMERLLGLADFSGSARGGFNDAANQLHAVAKTASSTTVVRTVAMNISGQTLSNECYLTDYGVERNDTGELISTIPFVLQNGTVPTWS